MRSQKLNTKPTRHLKIESQRAILIFIDVSF